MLENLAVLTSRLMSSTTMFVCKRVQNPFLGAHIALKIDKKNYSIANAIIL